MSNKKQSSVEWFANKISDYLNEVYGIDYYDYKLTEQAEAMRKQEIMDAYEQGNADAYWELKHNEPRIFKNHHDYYKETYDAKK